LATTFLSLRFPLLFGPTTSSPLNTLCSNLPEIGGRQYKPLAFEDPSKAGDKALYDLAIPGDMGVKIEYLGSVSADLDDENYIPLTADPENPDQPISSV
jgi:hypothetical protein